ncbi:hypothetical protein Tco_0748618 [Tanacetum coccineum]|uniref:Uncharacterized protein n=1 Tax=Tanacetum coccineum TaxID=301880 RepID=A0ABQ4YZ42_9ASTR
MIEVHVENDLKEYVIVDVPKLERDGYTCEKVTLEYECKPLVVQLAKSSVKLHGVPVMDFCEDGLSVIATKIAMIELRADEELKDTIVVECPKNIGVGVAKNLKKPSQTSRGVPVGPKVGFKHHKEYRPVLKKATANSSGKKKKCVEPTNEVSNSNPFDVLNMVDNDIELGTNGRTLNSGNNEKAILVDEGGNPLKKVEYSGDHDSEDEVASVNNHMARSMASERFDFGTQSLLEQWRDSYGNGDYDDDPYDDMYEGQDLPKELQTICDNLDI